MTTYNIKSTIITNRDATPKVLTDALLGGGGLMSVIGSVQTFGAADGSGSIYRMVQVPSNARVEAVKIQNDALATSAAVNVGVYWPTYIPVGAGLSAATAATVINTALFASALAVATAAKPTDITNQSGNNTVLLQEQPLWQAAGLPSDPGIDLDICVSVSTAIQAQGYIGLKVAYQE